MPRNRNRNRDGTQNRNVNDHQQDRPFIAQDANANIPHQDARVFAMHESLIQSYTHFTYYANHMYHLLSQSLHGTQNSINTHPYPWLRQVPVRAPVPAPVPMPAPAPVPVPMPMPVRAQAPRQTQTQTQAPRQTQTQAPRQAQAQAPRQTQGALETSIINALLGFTHRPLPEPRLTQTQLNERVQHTAFRNILNPINNVCSITHDVFEPNQQVARIRHCGHIFKPDGLAQWLRINNTCPTCRHNLLSSAPNAVTPNAVTTNATTMQSNATTVQLDAPSQEPRATTSLHHMQIPFESEININTFYNELLRNSTNIPGFELNAVDDSSVVFSFDLINNNNNNNDNDNNDNNEDVVD